MSVTQLKTSRDSEEWQLRVDLAAAFRLAVEMDWHEGVGNHFSAAVSPDGKKFLMNRKWRHFSTIRASDLQLLDAEDDSITSTPEAPDVSAWAIHGGIHANAAHARVLLHLHPPYATALAGLADPELKPIDQNTARFYNRLIVDLAYTGIAEDKAEGLRLARALGNKRTMMMGNHGVLCAAPTVAEAFEDMYFLERAAKTMVLAYSTGQKLNIMPDGLAEHTARGWEDYTESAFAHFEQLKQKLDKTDPSYKE
ncbi:MAG: class II aldolase/adducin family protein [Dongiaceae bacterium]